MYVNEARARAILEADDGGPLPPGTKVDPARTTVDLGDSQRAPQNEDVPAVAHAVAASGRKPRRRVMDLWIAATAMVHSVPLLTRNPQDFVGLESLLRVRAV